MSSNELTQLFFFLGYAFPHHSHPSISVTHLLALDLSEPYEILPTLKYWIITSALKRESFHYHCCSTSCVVVAAVVASSLRWMHMWIFRFSKRNNPLKMILLFKGLSGNEWGEGKRKHSQTKNSFSSFLVVRDSGEKGSGSLLIRILLITK